MAMYKQWNTALYETLFPQLDQNRPVYLHVDEETLEEIAEQESFSLSAASSIDDLAQSVRSICIADNKVDLAPLLPNSSDDIPIQIGFLSLTVLAAGRMESSFDESLAVSSTNFYARINALLGIEGAKKEQGFNNLIVERLWLNLRQTLLEQQRGDLQISTGAATRRFVWYPISQSLLSRHDRHKLWTFFKESKCPIYCPTDHPIPSFNEDLVKWAGTSNLSARSKSLLTASSERQSELIAQVRRELSEWDGSRFAVAQGVQSRRNSAIEIRLDLSESGGVFLYALVRRRPSFDTRLQLEDNSIKAIQLTCDSPQSSYYDPLPLPDEMCLGRELCFKTTSSKFTYSFLREEARIIVFRRDTRFFGSLVTCERLALNEEVFVAVHPDRVSQVMLILRQITGLDEAKLIESRRILSSGWVLFCKVRAQTNFDTTDPIFSCLVPDRSLSVEVEDGIQLADAGKRRVFMWSAQPNIRLIGDWNPSDRIELNGEPLMREESLVKLPRLEVGNYTITYGHRSTLRFVIKRPELALHVPPLIWLQWKEPGVFVTSSEPTEFERDHFVSISGANISGKIIEKISWNNLSPHTPKNRDELCPTTFLTHWHALESFQSWSTRIATNTDASTTDWPRGET